MIRSTVNATTITVSRSGIRSESVETVYGDNGTSIGTFAYNEVDYDALPDATLSPLHSKEHWNGSSIERS